MSVYQSEFMYQASRSMSLRLLLRHHRVPCVICHRLMWCTHRPLADSMDHLLATIFHPDTTSTHPNAAVTCITGRHPIVAKSDGQGLQEPHNRGSWCLIEECLPWLKPYSSSTALI